ncbi:RluA family pseudouridine synthase [Gramella sp. AN32]|uniref:RluA family pseudouridine synthase n=1 Tax=Christiangramia antarctica TaxID=2058158 RepID=A0ABW5X950_9FLAO|nr:RluA family pseudouridine synthase [Gramella sp. AN32]MCM4155422.1 RNA pseudouridine synthase [Gramella sp. AN32]
MKILETHIVPAVSQKIRLQEYAVSIFINCPTKSSLKKAIKKKQILVDGIPATTSLWVEKGMQIDLLQDNQVNKIFELQIPVLFEDEFVAVVNKPPGLPTSGNFFKTLENCLPYNLKFSGETDALNNPLPAHRLDSSTSGLVVCAKTQTSLRKLQQDFQNKCIEKEYVALVYGKLDGTKNIEIPIQGKKSKTIVTVLASYKIDGMNYTLIRAKPETGRTHQIRIHLSDSGYPLVGDKIYSNIHSEFFKGKSLFLFARKLKFQHPLTSEQLQFSLPLPKKFRNLKNLKGSH